MTKLVVFTDGASSGNPGPGYAMFVIQTQSGITLKQHRVKLEHCTNNEAEYKGVIYALEELIATPHYWQTVEVINFKIDSNLVVQQLNGFFKVKHPAIRQYVQRVNLLLQELPKKVVFQYIPREENLADRLKYD
jgi:ribonuclease HI